MSKSSESASMQEQALEAMQALSIIRKATDGACDGSSLIEAVQILISQRDNARHYAETYRQKLKTLGVNLV